MLVVVCMQNFSAVGSLGVQHEENVALAFGLSSERVFQVHHLEISVEPFQPCTATKIMLRILRGNLPS